MTSTAQQTGETSVPQETPAIPGHWLLGSLLEFKRAPHRFLSEIGKLGHGLVQFRLFHKRQFVVTDIETANEIFKSNSQNFPRGAQRKALQSILGLGLITQEGQLWKHQRRVVAQAFRQDFLQYSLQQNGQLVSQLLKNWEERLSNEDAIDVVEEMRRITLSVIAKALFSIDIDLVKNQNLYSAIVNANHLMFRRHTSLLGLPHWVPTPLNRAIAKTRQSMDDFITECMEAKSNDPDRGNEDIVDHFLGMESEGEMSRQQIYDEIRTLLVAGFETTATSLAWTLYLLSRDPDAIAKWQQELDEQLAGRVPTWEDMRNLEFTECIVKEGLRLYPPAYAITRSCSTETTVNGYRIPGGAAVALSIYGIQRSERYYHSPDRFIPDRFRDAKADEAFIPFGLGKHVCIGSRFSILEAMLILACIGQKFDITQAQEKEIEPSTQVTLLPSEEILLKLSPR